jgi:hypothetical protein
MNIKGVTTMQNDMRDKLKSLIDTFFCSVDIDKFYSQNQKEKLVDWLSENGVIVPPCKVGQTVYCIVFLPIGCYLCVRKGFVREIHITEENVSVNIVDCEHTKYANLNIIVPLADFGKTVFFTKDQAEQKLKELRENG